jgi:hypothetical protein
MNRSATMGKFLATVLVFLAAFWLVTQSAAAQEATTPEATTPEATTPDEEPSLKAFSAWNAQGQIFQSGESRVTFVGSFSGIVYVEQDQGPVAAGFMACPTVIDVNTRDGKERGDGRCTFTAKDGAQLFADFSCRGVRMVGCHGDFTFTGGTERFKGITGGGPVTIRSSVDEIKPGTGGAIDGVAAGIIFWPKLTYKLAAQ